ncbi:class I SAM-dependent methyltransferase [Tissierella sp. MSJ-40]|uniref:Class I SAM-dependent methyltransferase n=1 Tax=Tissierella simiarum TaxID=2841534 RepID=A0ABS6E841_9FIRM|nr:class I SAM-dependent methyltransferase [Tissierella simiarum]MBU5439066.1 class I SAM-dependent methyltransferase [Tissierella simiarum]
MDIYNKFATLYDELMTDFDYENWFIYIKKILEKFNKNPHKVLEMACGTGNLSYYLAKEGYQLTCFDFSSDMLTIAYDKLYKFKNLKLLNQNMINFKINNVFDCIISICDSINYITDEKDLLDTFINVRNHLEEGGIFIFDINSYYKLKYIIGNNTFVEDREDVFYTWQNYFDEENNICEFYLTFFMNEDGENYIRFDEEHKERAYEINEVVELLTQAGFREIDFFEGFSFKKPYSKSERINFIAIK